MPKEKRASIRKQPTQARSRERVQRIIIAAREILADLGFLELTVNAVAAKAGIPAPSIYQYFSDKEAILKVIALEEIAIVRSAIEQVEETYYQKADWRTFFDHLWNTIYTLPIPQRESTELNRAVHSNPEVAKLLEQHRAYIADLLVRFLQGYGSKWPRQRLLTLSLLVFDVYLTVDASAAKQPPSGTQQLETWRKKMINVLMEDALAEA